MFIDELKSKEKYYLDHIHRATNGIYFFRPKEYTVKLSAVRKLIKDINNEEVSYTKNELKLLGRGKLGRLLRAHKNELPMELNHNLSVTAKRW